MKKQYKSYNIAVALAPKTLKEFKEWHKLACPTDPLTADERFEKDIKGYKEPANKSDKSADNKKTKG